MISPSALPAPADALVGRTEELARVREALLADAPLVTITGPVGVGKTRLAIEAARQAVADGVVSGARVVTAPSSFDVGPAFDGGDDGLVVLDGLDDGGEAARATALRWLTSSGGGRLLVTARARLGLPGEHGIELHPLAVPAGDALEGDAVEYFLRCARQVRPGYMPSPAEALFVAALVRELDGLPLALSLAAPRLAVMGPAALLHRLRTSRSMLEAHGTAPASAHRSFDAALEGTWLALEAWEKDALAQLTVFDDFTVEAAEAVLVLPQTRPSRALEILRAKSLLSVRDAGAGGSGQLRLHLLLGVADFVRRRSDPRVVEGARQRHAAYYGWLARLACHTRETPIGAEAGNLRRVLDRVLATTPATLGDAEPALWALLALAQDAHEVPASYGELLERVIRATQGTGVDPVLVGRTVALRAVMRRRRGELVGATTDLALALKLARTAGAVDLEAQALLETSHLLGEHGEHAAARQKAAEAVELLARGGSRELEAAALLVLAEADARAGDFTHAGAMVERAQALATSVGDRAVERRARTALAGILLDLGQHDAARVAIDGARHMGPQTEREAVALGLLECVLLHDQGEVRAALDRYAACAEAARAATLAEVEASALLLRGVAWLERGVPAEAYAALRAALVVATGETRTLGEALVAAVARSERPSLDALPGVRGRLVARAFDRASGEASERTRVALASVPPSALVVGAGGRWFQAPSSEPTSLERRRPLARMLEHLARARQSRPGSVVTREELQQAAWPDERMLPTAGAHRVRVAVSTMRKLGLRDLLLTRDDGYLLDEGCAITRVEDP